MRKGLLLSLLGTFLFQLSSFAQIGNIGGASNEPLRTSRYTNVIGSPYYFDDWTNGNVSVEMDGKTQNNMQIRYNIHTDRLEYMHGGQIFIYNPGAIEGFSMFKSLSEDGTINTFDFVSGFEVGEWSKNNFFRVIYSKEGLHFLEKAHVKLVKSAPAYGTSSSSDVFSRKEDYFLIKPNGEVQEVKRSKGNILKALDNSQVKKFAKKQGINFSSDEELAAVFDYYLGISK